MNKGEKIIFGEDFKAFMYMYGVDSKLANHKDFELVLSEYLKKFGYSIGCKAYKTVDNGDVDVSLLDYEKRPYCRKGYYFYLGSSLTVYFSLDAVWLKGEIDSNLEEIKIFLDNNQLNIIEHARDLRENTTTKTFINGSHSVQAEVEGLYEFDETPIDESKMYDVVIALTLKYN